MGSSVKLGTKGASNETGQTKFVFLGIEDYLRRIGRLMVVYYPHPIDWFLNFNSFEFLEEGVIR